MNDEKTSAKKRLKLNKKNLFWILTGVAITFVIIIGIVIAVNMVNKKTKMCTAYFESSGGTQVKSISFKCGKENITKPRDPSKDGFKFLGWYYNNQKFDFNSKYNEDIKLSARWESDGTKETVKVVINTNGGTDMEDIELIKGTKLVISTTPEKEGYKFLGWFIDDEKFDFDKEVNEDIELKAKWEAIKDDNNTSISQNDRCYGTVGKSSSATLNVGSSTTMGGVFSLGLNYNKNCKITYKSNDTSIATIDYNGNISTKKRGSTSLYACITDKKTNVDVDCFKGTLSVVENSQPQEITSFKILASDTYAVGETFSLDYYFLDKPFYGDFSSQISDIKVSNPNVLQVTDLKNRQLKAIGVGSSNITLILKNGVRASVSTTVIAKRPVYLEKIVADRNNIVLNIGESTKIKLTTYPQTEKYDITCYSKEDSIARCSYDGTIFGKGSGVTTIVFESYDGHSIKEAPIKVTVNEIKVNSIKLDHNSLNLNVGNTDKLIATIIPSNATYKKIKWSTSDKNVVSVNYVGGITALKKGTAVITATTEDGRLSDTCVVTVSNIDVQSVNLNKSNITLYPKGQETITATITPSNATMKNVTWSSSNESVATVNNGVITAHGVGDATITATVDGKSATMKVHVEYPPLSASGKMGVFLMQLGDYKTYDVYADIKATGGTGVYTYSIKVYKDGTLIKQVTSSTENELYTDYETQGIYYAEFEVKDSEGHVFTGRTPEFNFIPD